MYVLDTNVVSALRVIGRNPRVEAWAARIPVSQLFLSAVTVFELERGIVRKQQTDPEAGRVLRSWFDDRVMPAFDGRVLPFDVAAARILANYPVPQDAPLDDAIIAATAQSRGMTLATRNVRHVAPLGVRVVNPWDESA
ncbi:MAG TPA: type II toxin-antitoxin system VapC family toxin [Microbacterium sp.]|nr:type II toxin-antitoxin system VapC family toxin [Microbacterium sp.]